MTAEPGRRSRCDWRAIFFRYRSFKKGKGPTEPASGPFRIILDPKI
jgi:hypothetical protein